MNKWSALLAMTSGGATMLGIGGGTGAGLAAIRSAANGNNNRDLASIFLPEFHRRLAAAPLSLA
jgi:hypothetical protein